VNPISFSLTHISSQLIEVSLSVWPHRFSDAKTWSGNSQQTNNQQRSVDTHDGSHASMNSLKWTFYVTAIDNPSASWYYEYCQRWDLGITVTQQLGHHYLVSSMQIHTLILISYSDVLCDQQSRHCLARPLVWHHNIGRAHRYLSFVKRSMIPVLNKQVPNTLLDEPNNHRTIVLLRSSSDDDQSATHLSERWNVVILMV
jgi:hypothetical protein